MWSNNTSAKKSTGGPDDDMMKPGPRADSSAVADRYDVADLEQTSLRLKNVKESKKTPPRQARRKRGMKPGPQRRISTFSRQSVHAQQQAKRKPHSADGTSRNAKFKSVPRVQCKREASRIRRAIAADRSANDIAKQVTMPQREKVTSTREGK